MSFPVNPDVRAEHLGGADGVYVHLYVGRDDATSPILLTSESGSHKHYLLLTPEVALDVAIALLDGVARLKDSPEVQQERAFARRLKGGTLAPTGEETT